MDIECDCAIESCVRSSNLPSADRGSSAPDTAGRTGTGEAADGLRSGTCERTSRRAAPRHAPPKRDAIATAMPITRRGFPFASTSLASHSSRTLARAASRLVSCRVVSSRVVSLASSRLSQKERSTSRAQTSSASRSRPHPHHMSHVLREADIDIEQTQRRERRRRGDDDVKRLMSCDCEMRCRRINETKRNKTKVRVGSVTVAE